VYDEFQSAVQEIVNRAPLENSKAIIDFTRGNCVCNSMGCDRNMGGYPSQKDPIFFDSTDFANCWCFWLRAKELSEPMAQSPLLGVA